MIDRDWIVAHIPHRGTMCLLDRVTGWDDAHIVCESDSHRRAGHPLAHAGRLGPAALIEYAAQAMAVHGALLAGDTPPPASGYLTSTRDVHWTRPRIDDIDAPLHIRAERLSGNAVTVLYRFEVCAAGERLAQGRASAVLDTAALGEPTRKEIR